MIPPERIATLQRRIRFWTTMSSPTASAKVKELRDLLTRSVGKGVKLSPEEEQLIERLARELQNLEEESRLVAKGAVPLMPSIVVAER